jgi:predicted HicB family RNase H-like nuclease
MPTDLVGFTVYVSRELHRGLKILAAEDGRTLSNYVARLLAAEIPAPKLKKLKKP